MVQASPTLSPQLPASRRRFGLDMTLVDPPANEVEVVKRAEIDAPPEAVWLWLMERPWFEESGLLALTEPRHLSLVSPGHPGEGALRLGREERDPVLRRMMRGGVTEPLTLELESASPSLRRQRARITVERRGNDGTLLTWSQHLESLRPHGRGAVKALHTAMNHTLRQLLDEFGGRPVI